MNSKSLLLIVGIAALGMQLSGCDPKVEAQKQAHIREMERLRHQNAIDEINRAGAWQLKRDQQAEEDARKMAVIETERKVRVEKERKVLYTNLAFIVVPGLVIGFGWRVWNQKEAGIAHRRIDMDEAIKRDKERYVAVVRAIELLPEEQRQPLIEKWVDKGTTPALEDKRKDKG